MNQESMDGLSCQSNPIQFSKCKNPMIVVGIGASAGGLEALESFFAHAPADAGLAYVVIQHLSPDFKSLMDEILSRHTTLPIHRVEDGMTVEPNSIYLIPPRKEMIIANGKLLLTDKDNTQSLSMPIDTFFRSLAQDCDACAVGVILSGTGSDGSRGILDIHAAGGLVLAQDPETAKFDGMPRSAIETDIVDLVLAPDKMAESLARFVKRATPSAHDGQPESSPDLSLTDGMQSIFKLLRDEYGIDFSHYKPTTVERRVERRLMMTQSVDLDAYVRQLAADRGELNSLYKDLLIGVTKFFRDPEAFEELKHHVLPRLLQRQADQDDIRIWAAGCATGEEPYSLAILIHEIMSASKQFRPVKIFATDVHRASLEVASAGNYSAENLSQVSPDRLQHYFIKQGERYQVQPELRKMIVFAPHNIIRDAPFTRLDLVVCRNMLIYLQPPAQKKVLSMFHFGLKADGVLFLGPSETPGDFAQEFEPLNNHWRIYRKRRDVRLPPELRMPHLPNVSHNRLPISHAVSNATNPPGIPLMRAYDSLLNEFMPPGFILNAQREVVHIFGGASRFLQYRDGRPSRDVLDLVDSDLKLALAGALHRAAKEDSPVRYAGVRAKTSQGTEEIRLTVRQIDGRENSEKHVVVLLEPVQSPARTDSSTDDSYHLDQVSREQLSSLESELQYTRENLQATLEEMETSNEELQATNEELIASNEELQSTNEELHSVNEELYTVNAEYQRKIVELTEMTDDLNNLFQNLEEGVAFLDKDLCIRKFTPPLGRVFQLMPQDIGRRIDTFAHNILYENLLADLRHVLTDSATVEREVVDRQGNSYLLRVVPYRTRTRIDGVVLKLLDVSNLKRTAERVRLLSKVFMDGADPIIIEDLSGKILDTNLEAERAYGWTRDELVGHNVDLLQPENLRWQSRDLRQHCLANEQVRNVETLRKAKDGSLQPILKSLSLLTDDAGKPIAIATIAKNIAALKSSQEQSAQLAAQLTASNHELQSTVEQLSTAENIAREGVRRRDQFLAMLSHELRNPMAAVVTAAQVLEFDMSEVERQEAVKIIRRQSEHITRLLDDLLDVARVTEGKIELRQQAVDLVQLTSDVLQTTQAAMTSRGHDFQVKLPAEPLYVWGDRARLVQVQANLLNNAAKYTPPGGVVQLILERDGEEAIIRVVDNGMGISRPMLDSVFELFVQADHTLHRSEGGMGVGLTLVKSLVGMQGGKVTVHSDGLGKGSEFFVRLPRIEPPAVAPGPAESPITIGPLRVLVVEDNPDSRQMLRNLLSVDGHEVILAGDGLEGLETFHKHPFDVALIDVGLPGIDGLEIVRRIRQSGTDGKTLLAALTGYGQEEDRRAALQAGFDVHMVKPVKLDELKQVLAQAKRD